jgi:NAD(P)-dependent dehydrogenase (short-subunit alcohol dehydrogenase family)
MGASTDRAALVTGASGGIGRATALAMARTGAGVVVADIDAEGGSQTVQMIEREGGRAIFIRTDVTAEPDVRASVQQALDRFGRLDVAVNNAGVEQSNRPITEVTSQECDRILAINVRGVLLGMKHQIPAMLRSGGGAIVNVSSIAGLIGFPGASVYVASKHAVLGRTKTAALEHARNGIRVNAVCPGAIQTPMIDRFAGEAKAALIEAHPLGRIGQPEEVAAAILWFCSPGAAFVTGQSITIDGGYTVQ